MTDDHTSDPVDDRIRSGLAVLISEAHAPPPMPTADEVALARVPSRRHPAVWLAVAVAAVVGLAASVVVSAVIADEPKERLGATAQPSTTAPKPNRPLFGTNWWLESIRTGQGEVELFESVHSELRFGHIDDCGRVPRECEVGEPQVSGFSGCNAFSGRVTVGGTALLIDRVGQTAAGCTNPPGAAVEAVLLRDQDIGYEIAGDELRLVGADGTVLTYRASDSLFRPTGGAVLDDGVHRGYAFRLMQIDGQEGHTVLEVEVQGWDEASSTTRGVSSIDGSDTPDNFLRMELGPDAFVFGLVPAAATHVVYRVSENVPVELTIYPIDSGFQVAAGIVPAGGSPWVVIATDADGNEVARYTRS